MCKYVVDIFRRLSGPGELMRHWGHEYENKTMRTITPCLHAQKFQLRSFYSLGGKVRTTRPFKIEKTCEFSNLDVITIEKKVYQIFMIIYQA